MRTATIFESYAPLEQYQKMAAAALGHPLEAAVHLEPIDAFILRQLVECYPLKLNVIDEAAQASQGLSTVLWATLSNVQKIVVAEEQGCRWKELVAETMSEGGQPREKLEFVSRTNLLQCGGPVSQVLVMVAATSESKECLSARLTDILSNHKNAIVVLTPVGSVGACSNLEAGLSICRQSSDFRFALLREISPFCASSQLGLIFRRDNDHIPAILDRIRQLYAGNFDFLGALEVNVELQTRARTERQRSEQLKSELEKAQADLVRLKRALAQRTEELEAAYEVVN